LRHVTDSEYEQIAPGDELYSGQAFVQVCLLLLALICVPWMLCTKPYLLYREHMKIKEQGYHGIGSAARMSSEEDSDAEGGRAVVAEPMDEEHEFDMGEHIIHQVIRTSTLLSSLELD
jgi:V-type H+-transporting ATPase subunit a